MSNTDRTLSRDITATQIPSGDKHTLAAGTKLFIHQTLGGSYTVQTDFGLFRLDGKDADAIGETVVDHSVQAATLTDGAPDPAAIWDQLKRVYDPEIPVDIYELGLIYFVDVRPDRSVPEWHWPHPAFQRVSRRHPASMDHRSSPAGCLQA